MRPSFSSALLALAVLSCREPTGPADTPVSVQGATVSGGDGRVTLIVPPQALTSEQRISIRALSVQELGTAIGALSGTAFSLEPAGLALLRPASVSVRVDASTPQQIPFDELALIAPGAAGPVELPSVGTAGTRTVSATIDRLSVVWVRPLRVATLAIAKPGTDMTVGDVRGLTAVPSAASGRVLARAVTWSSTSSIATVDAAGAVRAIATGATWVVAECEGLRDSVRIAVNPPVQRIDITPLASTLLSGDTLQLRAVARDAGGGEVAAAVEWTTGDSLVATISAAGVLIARRRGVLTVVARAGGVTSAVSMTVADAAALESITAPDGQPVQLTALAGAVLVKLRVATVALPVRALALSATCPRTAPMTLSATTDATGVALLRLPTDSIEAATGAALMLNGACVLSARVTTNSGAVRASPNVDVMLANASSFVASYDVSGSNAPLGTPFPAAVTAPDGKVWRTGSVTLRLQVRNYDGPAAMKSVRGTFLGRTFDVTASSTDGRFAILFPNAATDVHERGIAEVVSPATGSLPSVTGATFADGSPGFTRLDASPLYLDNQAPLPARFTLPATNASIGWVGGAYAFTAAAGFTSGGSTSGIGGVNSAVYVGPAVVAPLAGGSAIGAACSSVGLQPASTGADVIRVVSLSTALTNRSFSARVFETDQLGNVRCADLATGPFGVDVVPPTLRRSPNSIADRTLLPGGGAPIRFVAIAGDAESGMLDPHMVQRRTVAWSASSGFCRVGGPGCTATLTSDSVDTFAGLIAHWRDSVVAIDRVGNVSAPLVTDVIDSQNMAPQVSWLGHPAVLVGGSTFPLDLTGTDALGVVRLTLEMDYQYSRSGMHLEVAADTITPDRWQLSFTQSAQRRLFIRGFMRKLQQVDQSDAPYNDASEYTRAYGIVAHVENLAGIDNVQFYGLGDKNMPLGFTYFGKGVLAFRVTTPAISVANGGASNASVVLSADWRTSLPTQIQPVPVCFWYKVNAPWYSMWRLAGCQANPNVTSNSTSLTHNFQLSWNPPAYLGTAVNLEIRAIAVNATGDGLATNSDRSVTLVP